MVLGERLRLKGAAEGFSSKFWGLSMGRVSRWMDTQGETIIHGELGRV